MLKKRELHEAGQLFDLLIHPEVYPYVRHKAETSDEYYFLTKQLIALEEQGTLITRTILDEWQQPIGTINLCDIQNSTGFLATWLGRPFFGKGYNYRAKEAFLTEIFFEHGIEAVFMKIRKSNHRSKKAAQKLSYVSQANQLYPDVYTKLNELEDLYDLYVIQKDQFLFYSYQKDQLTEKEA
ncbi:GNAT family N-acetyltransferase [Salinibacillus xinjiangensis]|uniref:GNAT family N-acetyltransferase n=1 Tax=Salinibacillus xinjiangensis TaxID=1229268 RepID=A0A6G1X976_9BACI|nr:GNAT family protein [Salinibacillus xinjiangensis]MRG87524.1 GNAT family N-acetyltransferase [Salinibacillus xinjiangensis]